MSDLWRDTMVAGFRDAVMQILLVLPRLLALVTFLSIGLLMAWLVKALTVRVLTAFRFDRLCERCGLDTALAQAGIKQPVSVVLSRVLFWTVFLLFAFMGVDAVNLPATANLISQIVGFLPNVLAAALVLLVGVLSANFFAEAALIAAVNAQLQEARIVASLVRWGILLFTFAMVLTQLGIAKEIVISAFSITFGGVVFALALGVGLGIRHLMRETIERRLRKKKEEKLDELSHL
jgi:mechanosensitive ion channel-like protein